MNKVQISSIIRDLMNKNDAAEHLLLFLISSQLIITLPPSNLSCAFLEEVQLYVWSHSLVFNGENSKKKTYSTCNSHTETCLLLYLIGWRLKIMMTFMIIYCWQGTFLLQNCYGMCPKSHTSMLDTSCVGCISAWSAFRLKRMQKGSVLFSHSKQTIECATMKASNPQRTPYLWHSGSGVIGLARQLTLVCASQPTDS